MIACVIPARGGSKGIPGKNLVPVAGKPLIEWSIRQAQHAELVDEVCVATDDEIISRTAISCNARVYRRSKASATDDAPSELSLVEVVQSWYPLAEAIVFLQATSPSRAAGDIDGAVRLLRAGEYDSVFSVRRIIGYTWRQRNGNLVAEYRQRLPRQQLKEVHYEENGSIYVFRPQLLLRTNNRIGGKVAVYEMHSLDSYQIDEPEDVTLLDDLMRLRSCH